MRRKPVTAALNAVLVALATAIAWNVWESELFRSAPEKSIAVLPFENLSRDPITSISRMGCRTKF